MKGWIALAMVALLVGAPAWAASGSEAPASLRDLVARELAARGASIADLPEVAPLYRVDLATGVVQVEERPLGEVLALFDGAGPGSAAPEADLAGGAHHVVGDVGHGCIDFTRDCYKFHTNALGPGTPLRVQDLKDTYNTARGTYDGTPARGVLAFPLKGAQAFYVQGRYFGGAHVAASAERYLTPGNPFAGISVEDGLPGSGTFHGDRSLWGAGVGQVIFTSVPWGPNLTISAGMLRAYGAWNFCPTETDPGCNPAP